MWHGVVAHVTRNRPAAQDSPSREGTVAFHAHLVRSKRILIVSSMLLALRPPNRRRSSGSALLDDITQVIDSDAFGSPTASVTQPGDEAAAILGTVAGAEQRTTALLELMRHRKQEAQHRLECLELVVKLVSVGGACTATAGLGRDTDACLICLQGTREAETRLWALVLFASAVRRLNGNVAAGVTGCGSVLLHKLQHALSALVARLVQLLRELLAKAADEEQQRQELQHQQGEGDDDDAVSVDIDEDEIGIDDTDAGVDQGHGAAASESTVTTGSPSRFTARVLFEHEATSTPKSGDSVAVGSEPELVRTPSQAAAVRAAMARRSSIDCTPPPVKPSPSLGQPQGVEAASDDEDIEACGGATTLNMEAQLIVATLEALDMEYSWAQLVHLQQQQVFPLLQQILSTPHTFGVAACRRPPQPWHSYVVRASSMTLLTSLARAACAHTKQHAVDSMTPSAVSTIDQLQDWLLTLVDTLLTDVCVQSGSAVPEPLQDIITSTLCVDATTTTDEAEAEAEAGATEAQQVVWLVGDEPVWVRPGVCGAPQGMSEDAVPHECSFLAPHVPLGFSTCLGLWIMPEWSGTGSSAGVVFEKVCRQATELLLPLTHSLSDSVCLDLLAATHARRFPAATRPRFTASACAY